MAAPVSASTRLADPADDLLAFIDASPTPWHAVAEAIRRLAAAGYRELDEKESWTIAPGDKVFVVRGGSSILAFEIGAASPASAGFRLVGAHTDSPNLRVKPSADVVRYGYRQLGVEIYGGVLLSTWLDRDLSLAGRVFVRGDGGAPAPRLVDFRRALLRIPNLAIHLNRTVNAEGLILNPQLHMSPILGLEDGGATDLKTLVAEQVKDVAPADVISWDLCAYDAQPGARAGVRRELIHVARLDNLASCHAGVSALLDASGPRDVTRGVVLYDHEECGSRSAQGAASPFLRSVLSRLVAALDGAPDAFDRAMQRSFVVSADMAHAVHPNYAERHEPQHQPVLGRGPVVKINTNQSYATDAESWARFETWCRAADVAPQHFVTRTDMPCGSTIGPITAGELGIRTVDVGNPMLSMHSAREMAAAADVPKMIAVMTRFFGKDA